MNHLASHPTLAQGPCLLVVDDDPLVAGMLSQALQEWGYDVCVASNGWEGLVVASRRLVDGILLDMHMPIMDGRTMIKELRRLGHQMPVLMMSGGSDERIFRQLLKEGAQGFFLKPFHLNSLKQVCRQVFTKEEVKEQASSHSERRSHELSGGYPGTKYDTTCTLGSKSRGKIL